jgi:hypothetical protein
MTNRETQIPDELASTMKSFKYFSIWQDNIIHVSRDHE